MPLSEEEQRILQEMEQKLYEHDRAFVERVGSDGRRVAAARSMRWSIAVFVAGFAILLLTFQTSLLVGTFGFLVMLFSTLSFERGARQALGARAGSPKQGVRRQRPLGDELGIIGRRIRSRLRRER